MADLAKTTAIENDTVPEPGQLVEIRRRQWVVSDIERSSVTRPGSTPQNLVTMTSIEDDALGEECRVIWEIEPGARILEKAGLPTPTGLDEPRRLQAFLDAVRWGAATNADVQALQSPFRSGIAIEDYQLDPVVRSLQMARVNLLIADDVGLGKTIEAGLVLQELLLRHRARNILIVCPASLLLKWQTEMTEKFGLEFRIVDTDYLRELRRSRGIHTNPWTSFPRLITSIDWLKNDIPLRRMREALPQVPTYPRKFDILIVDEAHNVAPSGSGNYATDSLRTRAIRTIASHFEHRLFLSATPHNGYQESFTSLLELLDDQRFARGIPPEQDRLARVMVRRLKSDIVDEHGNKVFPDRKLEPLEITYTDEERQVHVALMEYSSLRQASVKNEPGRHATDFVMKLLKKRLFSSPAAFAMTLEKHRQSLAARPTKAGTEEGEGRNLQRAIHRTEEDYANDDLREGALGEAMETAGTMIVPVGAKEKELLDQMMKWAQRAKDGPDSKGKAILDWMAQNIKSNGKWTDKRVIVFTEYLSTQKWLVDVLTAEGLGGADRLMTIYGGMDKVKREAIKAAFQADPKDSLVRILVATDAASEGIDLQNHCNLMIHAEIPWNPNVLEQRNGRIDRHGQRAKEVFIWHPVGAGYQEKSFDADVKTGTLEGDLEFLMIAARKVDAIRQDLGKVGPVIANQVEQALLGKRSKLDTTQTEKAAADIGRQLAIEKRHQEKVARLHQKLIESRDEFRLQPSNIQMAVHVALEIAELPPLQATTLSGAQAGTVFNMPAFQGTWSRCTEGLAHPHTGVRRPITFDHAVAAGRDDVVLVHLNHRLVQMCLRLLRAEVWAPEATKLLYRVTAMVVPDGTIAGPAIAVWSRLVVTGKKSQRLHEEVTVAAGILKDKRFSRLNVTQTEELVEVATPSLPSPEKTKQILAAWPSIEASIFASAEARSSDRMKYLQSTLERRRDQEIKDITKILQELKASIEGELGKPEPDQLDFWTREEQEQLHRNVDVLQTRLAAIPQEIERETTAIKERYADPVARTFPVAITILMPESLAGRRS